MTKHCQILAPQTLASCLLLSFFVPAAAYAQQEEQPEHQNLERIQVIGTPIKRSSSPTGLDLTVQETPQSISIIDADFIENYDLTDLEDVMQQATGISRYKYGAGDSTLFVARGYEVNSFVKDGLPNSIAGVQENRLDTVVYDTIEVLRGAAGIMAGAGEPSATLNLVTKKPVRDGLLAITAQVGSEDQYRVSIDASDSLTANQNLAGRVILAYEDENSVVDFENTNKLVAYTQLHSYLGADTQAFLTLHYQDTALNQSAWGLPIFFSDGSSLDVDESTNTSSPFAYNNNTYQGYHFKLSHQLHLDWQLNFAAQYTKTESDVMLTYFSGNPDKTTGLGLLGGDSRSDTTVDGVTYIASLIGQFELFDKEHQINVTYLNADFDSKASRYEEYDENLRPVMRPLDSIYSSRPANLAQQNLDYIGYWNNSNKEQSLALTSKISIFNHLHSVVGVKFFDFEHLNERDFPWSGHSKETADTTGESMYFGLVYQITDDISSYASYTDTYQPQLNMVDINLNPLDPITGRNLEAGLKASLLNNKLSINLAVFDALKKGVGEVIPQYSEQIPVRYRKIDGAQSHGFEFELSGYLTDSWSMTLGYSQFELEDQNGEDINLYAPRKTLNFNTLYTFNTFEVGLGLNWNEDTQVNILGVPGFAHGLPAGGRRGSLLATKEGQTLVSAHAKYTVSEQLSLQLHIRNVFDEQYYDTYGFVPKKYSEPRSYTLGLNYQF